MKLVAIFLVVAVSYTWACSIWSTLEATTLSYILHPNCKPSTVKEAVTCDTLANNAIPITDVGTLYSGWELHYNLMYSPYYGARIADANGLYADCPTNTTMLKELDIMTPWSGAFGAIALDGVRGYDKTSWRRCQFPGAVYPFLCKGDIGNGTPGGRLGYVSYIPLLHDSSGNHRWTLFGHCFNPKRPNCPNATVEGTSYNVFSLDQNLTSTDRADIIAKINAVGYNIANIIEPDYKTNTGYPSTTYI